MRNPPSSSKKITTTTTTKTTPCCIKVGLKRGPWTPEEDELLANYIKKEGEGRWRTLPKKAGLLRCGKSCRLRWMNYLRPNVKRGQIAPDEEDLILRLHRLLGNRWSLIAGRIPGRTDNEIKNYWNTHLSKKLINQGIDPRTHKPLSSSTNANAKANASSSLKAATRIPSPKSYINIPTSNSNLEETNSGTITHHHNQIIINNSNPIDRHYQNEITGHGYANLMNCDALMSNQLAGLSNDKEDGDMINDCTEDIFSSFINSLINEDPFANQHQLQHQPIGIASISDPMVPMTNSSALGYGGSWESALISSTFSQNDLKRTDEQLE